MKNLFKFGFLALALSLTVVACSSDKTAEGTDTTAVDSTVVDTTVVDSTVVVDTTKKADTTVAAPAAH
jgi:ABC-type glycerol-3-phosphate transport system substrate-binding protein